LGRGFNVFARLGLGEVAAQHATQVQTRIPELYVKRHGEPLAGWRVFNEFHASIFFLTICVVGLEYSNSGFAKCLQRVLSRVPQAWGH